MAGRSSSRRTRRASSARSRSSRCGNTRRTPRRSPAALGLDAALAARIYPRVVAKLEREPVEDYRIDFEDGFGTRPDAEEDDVARKAAASVVAGMKAGTLPPGIGIRIKNLGDEMQHRALRTLSLFVSTIVDGAGGALPENFVVTLPKITAPDQVSTLASACDALEKTHTLPAGSLKFEVMIETPESVFSRDGRVALPEFIARGQGRITGAHFGTYDYTASMGITAAHQHMLHPSCDFAKHVMQVALSGHGRLDVRRRDEHHADRQGPIGDSCRVEAARGSGAALARRRVLSGLGPASRAARHALRRGLCVLPRGPRRRVGAIEEFRPESRAGHGRRRRVRRRGDGAGAAELFPAGDELRCDHRRRKPWT